MSGIPEEDFSKLIRELIERTSDCRKKSADGESAPPVVRRKLLIAKDDSSLEGDPLSSCRELRRYLLEMAIDSRVFSFGTIPLPTALMPKVAVDIISVDNCFLFELRKEIEAGRYGDTVNALIILFRVFFEEGQDSASFWVQAVLNHHHDAVLEINELYRKTVIPALVSGGWSHPTAGSESTRISYLEKRYTSVTAFKREFNDMYSAFRPKGMRGNCMHDGPVCVASFPRRNAP
jgi:hypothetical protein